MNEKNWKKACCEASPIENNAKTMCMLYAGADVVEPDDDNTCKYASCKAVQCKGILTDFNIRY